MSIKKQYLKSKPVCKVTFSIPENGKKIKKIQLVGEFNNWDTKCSPMKKSKEGGFTETIELLPQKEYQYRLLINGELWDNDPEADKYVPNSFSGENSVIIL